MGTTPALGARELAIMKVVWKLGDASVRDVYETLRARRAILCVTDTDQGDTPFVATADCGYVRLRRTHYDDSELGVWANQIAAKTLPRTYVYFMHEDEALGTRFAQRLNELWSADAGVGITTATAQMPPVGPRA